LETSGIDEIFRNPAFAITPAHKRKVPVCRTEMSDLMTLKKNLKTIACLQVTIKPSGRNIPAGFGQTKKVSGMERIA
jgi:hypothetical protein